MVNAACRVKRSVRLYVLTAGLVRSVDVLCSSVQDSTLSVRVSAVSALANLADAWQQQQHQQLNVQLLPSLTKMAAGMLSLEAYLNCIDCQETSLLPTSQRHHTQTAHTVPDDDLFASACFFLAMHLPYITCRISRRTSCHITCHLTCHIESFCQCCPVHDTCHVTHAM